MKKSLAVAALVVAFLVCACNTPIDKAVEWSEEKTEELGDDIRGN